ncbi:MAG TPA: hypothetical protein VF316_17965, partial [Polyangiaceae bacterium]
MRTAPIIPILGLLLACAACGSTSAPPAGSDAGGIGNDCSGVVGECGGGTSCQTRSFYPAIPDAGGGCSAMTR